jgi:uncharacterized coiled-coil protein SlyX
VGHNAILHGCTVGDKSLVGMGAIILDHAVIGENSIVGAGALVTGGKVFPPGSLILGSPAVVKRPLRDDEIAGLRPPAEMYRSFAREYAATSAEVALPADDSLLQLETKMAYLEKTLEDLSAVVASQAKDMELLQSENAVLKSLYRELREAAMEGAPANQRPPHY